VEVVVGEAIVELEELDAGEVVVLLDVAGLVVSGVVDVTITVVCTGSEVLGAEVSAAPPQALAMTARVGTRRRRGFMMNSTCRPRRT